MFNIWSTFVNICLYVLTGNTQYVHTTNNNGAGAISNSNGDSSSNGTSDYNNIIIYIYNVSTSHSTPLNSDINTVDASKRNTNHMSTNGCSQRWLTSVATFAELSYGIV